ncbi:HD-GYP domain-containing protein [Paenibacillus doosanensis]|uniref:Cyclic di-GMP phosphodiesterase response regulator RpfG n=1 Tax=Paenibacillus konkukensis TaxID=2020716 RepID=A0ABY4RL16_9BACL|nr:MULTISPECIES: HD-GYP domain-containing protein [Paenibacillus]MCS7463644.1 HD-GYP domain-containing protein [Paenibacillus doosanensis]UQZ83169.1 Cyclic di-GMP phosphodiesterase response regulator RpfG [Paenibacillus konkukensis]
MRLLPLNMVRPGMRLGRKIYNEEGLTLLGERVELSQNLIRRLGEHGIDYVYIDDPRTSDVIIEDMITEETRMRATSEIRSTFRTIMEDSVKRKANGGLQLGKAFGSVMKLIIDDLSGHKDAMIMLTDISVMDDYLFQHSLNVCIYSTMLGMAHGYNRDELMTLGLGALLHDIGKTQIPLDLLRKSGKLTDDEFSCIKKHAEYGFRILKDEPNIPLIAAHCAFQHHERLNGSGYPRGIEGRDIHDYARWIGLVDSYDAMTTHRVYRKAMLPHQAMEILYTGVDTLYEKSKIELFRDKIAIYPIGVTVTLSTGEAGTVVGLNKLFPHRPIVRILKDEEGQELQAPFDLDLSQKLSVMIAGVNDED